MSTSTSQTVDVAATRRSSVDLAYDEILNRIVTGRLQAGTAVRGVSLARELGVSRTPVSQAIERLCSEGLLTQQLNHRAVVATGAELWFANLHEIRILLEPSAAAIAAGRISRSVIDRLYERAGTFTNAQECDLAETQFQFDFDLHVSIADASGNLMMRSILRKCMSYQRFAYNKNHDSPERLRRTHSEHLEILKAVATGNQKLASASMMYHLQSTVSHLPVSDLL